MPTNRVVWFAKSDILAEVTSVVEWLIWDVIVKRNLDPFATSLHVARYKVDEMFRDGGRGLFLFIPVGRKVHQKNTKAAE